MSETKKIKVSAIRIDGGTQSRVAIDEDHIADIVDAMDAGAEIPPVSVVFDGADYWLVDGFHRLHAWRKNGRKTIDAVIAEGTLRDAIKMACGANSDHGLKRTNADKRKAVEMLLADPEWSSKSDRWIAEITKVHHTTVATIRRQVANSPPADTESTEQTRTGRDGKEYPVEPQSPTGLDCGPDDDDDIHGEMDLRDDEPEEDQSESPSPIEYDTLGCAVPACLLDKAANAVKFAEIVNRLDGIKKDILKLRDMPGGEFLTLLTNQAWQEPFGRLRGHVKSCSYMTACTHCGGAGCHSCRGTGYFHKGRTPNLTSDEKSAIEQRGGKVS